MPDPTSRDQLVPLLITLSATTGLIDAVSVLGLGNVFTANMTGNIVFLGFAVADAPGYHATFFLAAIAAFATGALVAARTGRLLEPHGLRSWLLALAAIEASLLWSAAGVAVGYDIHDTTPRPALFLLIALMAFAMGARNATVRALKVPDLTTTVLTLTLTGLVADSPLAGGMNLNFKRRIGALVAMVVGAMAGAVLVLKFGLVPPLILAGVTILLATLLVVRRDEFA